MEYAGKFWGNAENGDLAKKIEKTKERKEKFEEEEIWKMIYHISKALKTLHERRVMHRDLKPANIVQTKDGKYKLADMNISKRVKEGELTKTAVGTPFYLSPEVFKNV